MDPSRKLLFELHVTAYVKYGNELLEIKCLQASCGKTEGILFNSVAVLLERIECLQA